MTEEHLTGEAQSDDDTGDGLPLGVQAAYAIGQVGWAILINLVGFWLVFLYSGEFDPATSVALVAGLALSVVAGGGRLFDAITDPLIAKFSDEATFDRGRRLPFMLVGGLPAAVFCVLVFSPLDPTGESAISLGVASVSVNLIWLVFASVGFYLCLTLYGTPYFALLPELSTGEDDRVNLATGIAIGWALGLVVASQASLVWNAIDGATALGRLGAIQAAVAALAALAVVCLYIPVIVINEREHTDPQPSSAGLTETLQEFAGNREFVSYVVADFSYFAGLMLIITALPFYTSVLLFPDQQAFAETLVGALTLGVVLTWFVVYPVVNVLAKRIGKKPLIRLSFLSLGVVFCFITVLGLDPIPLPPLVQAVAISLLSGIPMAFLAVLPNAVLGDVARLDALESGDPQEGMFFAGRTFVQKLGQSVGLFVFPALLILGDTPGDALGIRLSGVVGAVLCLGAFVAFRFYREGMVADRLADLEGTSQTTPGADD